MSFLINYKIENDQWQMVSDQLSKEHGFINTFGGRCHTESFNYDGYSDFNETCLKMLGVIKSRGLSSYSLDQQKLIKSSVDELMRIHYDTVNALPSTSWSQSILTQGYDWFNSTYQGTPLERLKTLTAKIS